MKFIKRHKGLVFICLLTLILFVIMTVIFSRMLFSTKKGEYGDRLDGIVNIKESTLKDITSKIKENEEVKDASIRIQGKIVYTTITFSTETSKDKAKEIAAASMEGYSDKVVEYYDFEFLLNQEPIMQTPEGEEKEVDVSFAIAGNKHPDNEKISWTKS